MRTVGIDLAVQDRTTAACVIDWDEEGAHVGAARSGCGDDDLLELLSGLAKGDRAGVDCPFGWPVAFADAVAAHMAAAPWPGRSRDRAAHYASLRLRRTDTYAGRSTLSVSFDKLGATAARWAHLADALAARGHPVDRAGAGSVVEVYPAASRHRWGLGAQRSMANVLEAAPYLRCPSPVYEVCDGDEHGPPPAGARAEWGIDLGSLVVVADASAETLSRIVRSLRAWCERAEPRPAIRLEIDGDVVEISEASAEQAEQSLQLFLQRHGTVREHR